MSVSCVSVGLGGSSSQKSLLSERVVRNWYQIHLLRKENHFLKQSKNPFPQTYFPIVDFSYEDIFFTRGKLYSCEIYIFFCKKLIKCELNTINMSCFLRWLEWDWWKWWKWWKQEIVNHRLDQLRETCSKVADTVSDFIPYLEYICISTLPFLLSSSCIYTFTMTIRWL